MTNFFALLVYNRTMRQTIFAVLLFFLLLLLTGCGANANDNPTPVNLFPTAIPSGPPPPTFISFQTSAPISGSPAPQATQVIAVAVTPSPVPPTSIPTLDANWTAINAGLQYRRLSFKNSQNQDVTVLVARVDPTRATFKVKYMPGQAKSIYDWAFALGGAALIVNGNYFDQSGNPIGLIATDGNLIGSSIGRNDGGMFQVVADSPRVRSLYLEPFNNTEHFDQTLQGFPLLVAGGQVAPAFNPDLNNTPDRRTVIAQDTHGRVLIIVTPLTGVSFTDMARWLDVSGLEVDMALNLDGGSATCMYLQTGGPSQITPGLAPVPVVLAVYPR